MAWLGALAVGVALLGPSGRAIKAYLFPREVALYVLDKRPGGRFGEDLRQHYTEHRQRLDGLRVSVHAVAPGDVWRSAHDLLRGLPPGGGMVPARMQFIVLASPTSDTKKSLQAAIAVHAERAGADRGRLLRRVVPLVVVPGDPDGAKPDACQQLIDDWIYADDSFGALGLVVDAQTLAHVGDCLPRALVQGSGAEPM